MTDFRYPVAIDDVRAANARIRPYLDRTPLRGYAPLDASIEHDISVLIKHENHLPTNSFKVRNGLAALTALPPPSRRAGVICGTRGNHGQGVAFAGLKLGIPVTVVVPIGNSPDKNAAMSGFGARLIEFGRTYDEAVAESERLAKRDGLTLIHSTNNRDVIAGAGTITLEVCEQAEHVDAMVIAVGGGSQAVGALVVLRSVRPDVRVYAVQASGAPAVYESWKAQAPVGPIPPNTIADGVATANSYDLTLPALCAGLAGFVTVSDEDILSATRLMLRTTHNLAEPSGAVGLAGLLQLRHELAGQTVCVILSGSNVDSDTLMQCLAET